MKKIKVYYQDNLQLKTTVIDESELKEFPFAIIRIKQSYTFKNIFNKRFVSKEEVLNLFYQLNVILNAKIEFVKALELVLKKEKNPNIKMMLAEMITGLKSGYSLYEIASKYDYIIGLEAVEFIKLSHNRVTLKTVIKSIYKLLKKKYENRNLIVSKLRYPFIVMITLFISLIMIFSIVIPKFEFIFTQYAIELPLSTRILLDTKNFIFSYSIFMIIFFVLCYILLKRSYTNSYKFSFFIDKMILKLPIIGRLLLVYELYKFFISLDILLKAKFDFEESFNNAMVLLKNKYILDRISLINLEIRSGCGVATAFKCVNIFDDIILSLIYTGEQSASLNSAISQIIKIYKEKFNKSIKDFSSLIEPIFFISIMLLILWVVLSIFVPIWDMQEVIKM